MTDRTRFPAAPSSSSWSANPTATAAARASRSARSAAPTPVRAAPAPARRGRHVRALAEVPSRLSGQAELHPEEPVRPSATCSSPSPSGFSGTRWTAAPRCRTSPRPTCCGTASSTSRSSRRWIRKLQRAQLLAFDAVLVAAQGPRPQPRHAGSRRSLESGLLVLERINAVEPTRRPVLRRGSIAVADSSCSRPWRAPRLRAASRWPASSPALHLWQQDGVLSGFGASPVLAIIAVKLVFLLTVARAPDGSRSRPPSTTGARARVRLHLPARLRARRSTSTSPTCS